MKYPTVLFLLATSIFACKSPSVVQRSADQFLDTFNTTFTKLKTQYSEAEWISNTRIVKGDTITAQNVERAANNFANYIGSANIINTARKLLDKKQELTSLQAKQLETLLYNAAEFAITPDSSVQKRTSAQNKLRNLLYSFNYTIDGKKVSTNEIDSILVTSNDLATRLKAWSASKEVGKDLKEGMPELRDLRNKVVKSLGYKDFFSYQVSNYGMTTQEMRDLCKKINNELHPLFLELHTYARYEWAKKYGSSDVPDYLPAHWAPNRWSQDWSSSIEVEGVNIDSVIKTKSAEWVVKQSEEFYTSLGYQSLPASFWEKSSLYPLPKDATYSKNNHGSAWHINLEYDVRSLMSVVPSTEWFETSHHELGHVYYFLQYTSAGTPLLLREGANRAFHEGIGSMIGMAALQKPYLQAKGLLPKDNKSDTIKKLLQEAMNMVVFIPWAAGTMTEFEHDMYTNNLPPDQFNKRWWELCKQYQGIVPPTERAEDYFDAGTKTHIIDDAGQYYDYALSYVILFQLHNHIAKNILHQDPHATNYYGSKEVGNFLSEIMKPGSSKDWRQVMKEATGEELSAKAMVEYFSPLLHYLKEVNKGRKYTLGEK